MSRMIRRVITGLWFLIIVFWPKPSNQRSPEDDMGLHREGEGLYSSTETKANFGLLAPRFYETSSGKKHWDIASETAELHRKENYAFLQKVDAKFHAERTGNVVTSRSDFGRSWTDRELVELEGNVVVESRKGYQFTMPTLNYSGKTHEFFSDDVVHMKGPVVEKPTMLLTGKGLRADIDRERFILDRDVVGRKKLRNNRWLTIRSKGGDFFTDESRAVFTDEVRAEMPGTIIDSEVFETIGGEKKETIEARGNVRLKNRGRSGKAETAFLEVGGTQIILDGKASIESKGNLIRGRRIILYTDEDRIEVEGASGQWKNETKDRKAH